MNYGTAKITAANFMVSLMRSGYKATFTGDYLGTVSGEFISYEEAKEFLTKMEGREDNLADKASD